MVNDAKYQTKFYEIKLKVVTNGYHHKKKNQNGLLWFFLINYLFGFVPSTGLTGCTCGVAVELFGIVVFGFCKVPLLGKVWFCCILFGLVCILDLLLTAAVSIVLFIPLG